MKNGIEALAEKDGFLESYKDRGSLVFKAVFGDRLWKALQLRNY
nr:MAG TPA: hypothetical protein [Caudoviricetes sp.]